MVVYLSANIVPFRVIAVRHVVVHPLRGRGLLRGCALVHRVVGSVLLSALPVLGSFLAARSCLDVVVVLRLLLDEVVKAGEDSHEDDEDEDDDEQVDGEDVLRFDDSGD